MNSNKTTILEGAVTRLESLQGRRTVCAAHTL